jgi:cobyrinic acid a,c-diamide synthase
MHSNPPFAQFLIAAPHSGAGKTTVTLGLLRALQNRGLQTQPFKAGPDFIDPMHHATAAGRPGINLDPYMMSPGHIRDLYRRYTADADVAISEGVMGLFDGARKREGSSADLAALLQLPVILILNAKAMAYTAAALLYGLKNFDPALTIAGAIFNFVDTLGHYQLLKEACEAAGITPLGHLPGNNALRIPSRHLGLDTTEAGEAIDAATRHIEQYLDLDALLAATRSPRLSPPPKGIHPTSRLSPPTTAIDPSPRANAEISGAGKTILVARDAAFQFLYPENLRRLGSFGRLQFFSPLSDAHLPPGDLLYLPGGYPELHLEQLSANRPLIEDIQTFAANGGRILAECGGMMYLGRGITDESGKTWPTAALLDIDTTIREKKLTLGYRTLTIGHQTLKGHEFHYSQFVQAPAAAGASGAADANAPAKASSAGNANATANTSIAMTVHDARGQEIPMPVFYRQNLFASYMHFYWGESLGPLETWLAGG